MIEDVRLERVEGMPRPWGMYYGYVANEDDEFATEVIEKIEGSDYQLEAMINAAVEEEAARADDYADYARKDRF